MENRLKILRTFRRGKNGVFHYECLCSCGNITIVNKYNYGKNTHSCGCIKKEQMIQYNHDHPDRKLKHGHCRRSNKNTEYRAWAAMKQRCTNPKTTRYHRYGERGITYCREWESFEKFYEDMGKRPDGMSLDRIDNDKGYSKENCRWTTNIEQCNNTSRNRYVNYKGKQITVSNFARLMGVNERTIRYRIKNNIQIDKPNGRWVK